MLRRTASLSLGVVAAMVMAWASRQALAGDARAAIAEAEKAVAAARARNALWTTADEALRNARRALEGGDEGTAAEQARVAADQAALGIAQKQYPLTR